jgi:hypothetical protein
MGKSQEAKGSNIFVIASGRRFFPSMVEGNNLSFFCFYKAPGVGSSFDLDGGSGREPQRGATRTPGKPGFDEHDDNE